jgi:hypothetical protein
MGRPGNHATYRVTYAAALWTHHADGSVDRSPPSRPLGPPLFDNE